MFPSDAPSVEDVFSEDSSGSVLDAQAAELRRAWPSVPPAADSDAVATQKRERLSPSDDIFQKIR